MEHLRKIRLNATLTSLWHRALKLKRNIQMTNIESLYKRDLPPTVIPYSSQKGRQIFIEALTRGTLETFFPLSEQFRTQDEPAYCGLTTLTMVLNALAVDPYRTWKGIWRWYHEAMLDCCVNLERVKQFGITFSEFLCLAECNGCALDLAQRIHLTQKSDDLKPITTMKSPETCSHCVPKPMLNPATLDEHIKQFRRTVKVVSQQRNPKRFLVVSYDRAALQQTMNGHFSPVAGFHEENDLVLIMDVARFKYPPHWVKIQDLVTAMAAQDAETGLPRGYVVIRKATGPDYGRLTLFQIELPPRSESVDIFCSFSQVLKTEILKAFNENSNVSTSPTDRTPKTLKTLFRCFLRGTSKATMIRTLISTARIATGSFEPSSPTSACDASECHSPLSDSRHVCMFSQSALEQLNGDSSTMLTQLENMPWFSELQQVFHEEFLRGTFDEIKMQNFHFQESEKKIVNEDNSSSPRIVANVQHLFVTLFLALLPLHEPFVPPSHWAGILISNLDPRLLRNCNENNENGESGYNEEQTQPDVVCAILRLREILDNVHRSCTRSCS